MKLHHHGKHKKHHHHHNHKSDHDSADESNGYIGNDRVQHLKDIDGQHSKHSPKEIGSNNVEDNYSDTRIDIKQESPRVVEETTRIDQQRLGKVSVLVCSGNLGNAQPDMASWNSWIPKDGACRSTLQQRVDKYPVQYYKRKTLYDSDSDESDTNDISDTKAADAEDSVISDVTNRLHIGDSDNEVAISQEGESDGIISSTTAGSVCKVIAKAVKEKAHAHMHHQDSDNETDEWHTGSSKESRRAIKSKQQYNISSAAENFDIIVIGMQEATFQPEPSLLGLDIATSSSSSSSSSHSGDSDDETGSGHHKHRHFHLWDKTRDKFRTIRNFAVSRNHLQPTSEAVSINNVNANGSLHSELTKSSHGHSSHHHHHHHHHGVHFHHSHGTTHGSNDTITTVEPIGGSNKSNRRSSVTASFRHKVKKAAASSPFNDGTLVLHKLLEKRLPNYQRLVSYQRGQMRLEIMVRRTCLPQIQVLHVAAQNTGRAGLANKGGIVAELLIDNTTRVSFITAHLEAHEGEAKYAVRCQTMGEILHGTRPPTDSWYDVSLTSHYSFCLGDLNFRTNIEGLKEDDEDEQKRRVLTMVERKEWKKLNNADELHQALHRKDCLAGYTTLLCNFPPTFKLERLQGYEYNDKRRPSYTDRVVYKTVKSMHMKPLLYEPVDDYTASDHKPIRAAFEFDCVHPLVLPPCTKVGRSPFAGSQRSRSLNLSDRMPDLENEDLVLFVNNIRCQLSHKPGKEAPDTYVRLVSSPAQILQQTPSKWQLLHTVLGLRRSKEHSGWPQTQVCKNSWTPDWTDEDLHSIIQTHETDGLPLDLSGCMLRMTVIQRKHPAPSSPGSTTQLYLGEDVILGTVCFPLFQLIQNSCPGVDVGKSARTMSTSIIQQHQLERESQSSGQHSHLPSFMHSMRNIFHRPNFMEGRIPSDDDSEASPLQSTTLDEPILLNGYEKGRLQCTLESWWLQGGLAARGPNNSSNAVFPPTSLSSLGSRHAPATPKSKLERLRKKIQGK